MTYLDGVLQPPSSSTAYDVATMTMGQVQWTQFSFEKRLTNICTSSYRQSIEIVEGTPTLTMSSARNNLLNAAEHAKLAPNQ